MDSDFPTDSTDTSPADIDEDSETSYAPGDTLGKLWAFINQVRLFCVHDSSHRYYSALGGESTLTQAWDKTRITRVGESAAEHGANLLQVRLSPQASAFFFRCCTEEGLPHLELVKYVRTRWSSMYDLLERAFKLKAVGCQFFSPLFSLMIIRPL